MEKRKRILVRVVSVLAVLALAGAGLLYLTRVTERKSSQFKLAPFFSENVDYDAVFLGTSHVLNAILPMELWDQYGILSYDLAAHGAPLPTVYWMLRLALDHCTPQVVVVDCMALEDNRKTSASYSQVHDALDGMPLGWTKVQAVADLLNDPYRDDDPSGEKREPLGLLWDFSVYHNRWDDLGEGDFNPTRTRQRGAQMKTAYAANPKSYDLLDSSEVLPENTTGIDYLRKIIELCRSRGIKIVLTFLPFPADETNQRSANTMVRIAEEYGIPCVNFLRDPVIRYETDMANETHVNFAGAQKLTSWMGQYLKDTFGFPDHRADPAFAYWNEDYQSYLEDKVTNLSNAKTVEEYFLMLKDPHLDTVIELYDRSIYRNTAYAGLLQSLGVNPEEMADNADLIVVRGGGEATVCRSFKKSGTEAETVLGLFSYRVEDRIVTEGKKTQIVSHYVISRDGEELFALPRDANAHTDLRIHVYEHGTDRLLLHTTISYRTLNDYPEGHIELLEMSSET